MPSGCFPAIETRELPDDEIHDYDRDGQTEADGDCDDLDVTHLRWCGRGLRRFRP